MKNLLKQVIREQMIVCMPGGSCQSVGPEQDYGFDAGYGDYDAEDYWMDEPESDEGEEYGDGEDGGEE